jgi:putative ABC transport system permease protein
VGLIWLLAVTEALSRKAGQELHRIANFTDVIVRSLEPKTEVANAVALAPGNLTRADFDELIRTVPMILQAAPMREIQRQISYCERSAKGRVVGCTWAYFEVTKLTMERGRFLEHRDNAEQRAVAVLGSGTASKLFPFRDPIGQTITIDRDCFSVVGVVSQTAEVDPTAAIGGSLPAQDCSDEVYIPLSSLCRLLPEEIVATREGRSDQGTLKLSEVRLRMDRVESVSRGAQLCRETLGRTHHANDYRVIVPLELLERARSTQLRLVIFAGFLLVILHCVGGAVLTRMISGAARHKEETKEQDIKTRPTSVTVIAWFLIVAASISLISIPAWINNPLASEVMGESPVPIPVQYAVSYVQLMIGLICGLAMLNKRNWARFLYVVCATLGLLLGIATLPMKAAMVPGLFVFATTAFFLFRPKANEYFSPTRAQR